LHRSKGPRVPLSVYAHTLKMNQGRRTTTPKGLQRSSQGRNRETTRSQVVAMYAPHRSRCPVEPPVVQNSIRVTKTVQFNVQAGSTESTQATITPGVISAAVPGGTTYWSKIRIQSVRIWAQTQLGNVSAGNGNTPVLRVDCRDDNVNEPAVSWTDTGTSGQRRPAIAFQLGLREQASWFGTANTQPICSIRLTNLPTGTEEVTVQAVVEILSPTPSS